jgi:hypothetical protein
MPRPDPLQYASPDDEQPPPRRSAGVWLSLAMVWGIGLLVWVLYIVLIVYLVFWFLS